MIALLQPAKAGATESNGVCFICYTEYGCSDIGQDGQACQNQCGEDDGWGCVDFGIPGGITCPAGGPYNSVYFCKGNPFA
jgi:hypothetical protein